MSVYDTYDFVVTPSSSKQQLWESTGEGRGVRPVRYTYENLKVEVHTRGGSEKVGFVVGSAEFREGQRKPLRDAACEINFARLVARHPDLRGVLIVTGSFLEEVVRGKGVGVAMYRVLAEHAGKQGLAIVPEYCWSGTALTSEDALRVWRKLAREPGFDAEGHTVYAPPARSNPRRRRNTALQTDTPAFKRWFGDSKVVDAKGEPLVVYHGTDADFDVFLPSFVPAKGRKGALLGEGFYFTSDPKQAASYGKRVIAAYLRIEHPRAQKNGVLMDKSPDQDGTIATGTPGTRLGEYVYVVKSPTQIKSATANAGTFDPDDPSILRNPRRRAPHPQVSTPAFQRWFGKSKVVDAKGEPLVMYHGTSVANFDAFSTLRPPFFTSDKNYAKMYSDKGKGGKAREIAVFLRIERPFDTRHDAQAVRLFNADFLPWYREQQQRYAHLRERDIPPAVLGEALPFPSADDFWRYLRIRSRRGDTPYDGLVVDEGSFPATWEEATERKLTPDAQHAWVPLDPTQIKSAKKNVGTFDPDDESILRNPRKKRVDPVLDPRHLALIETPAFKRWFRDSKVVDRLGRPLVVYHGSPDIRDVFGGMTTFRSPSAFFATDSYAVAGTYARGKAAWDYQNAEPGIVPLFVSIQNPMVIDAQGARWRKTEHHIGQAYRDGHDGIIIKNSVDDYMGTGGAGLATVYIWFDPRQAKSAVLDEVRSWVDRKPLIFATPNAGTFDPEDTDMRRNPDPPYREPTPAEVKRDEAARRLAAIIQHWNAWYAERIAETPSSERYRVYNYIYLPKVWTDLLLWLMGSDDVLGKHEKYLFLLDQPNRKNKQTYPPTPPFTPLQERRSTKLAFPASSFTYIGRQFGMGGTIEDMPEANDAIREFSETWQAFDGGSRIKTVAGRTSCSRCGGSGKLREYSHVEGGVCFKCGGSGRSGGG